MFSRIQRKMVMELVVHGDNCHKCIHYNTDKCKGKVDDDYCLKGIIATYMPTAEEKREKKNMANLKRYHEKKNDPEWKEKQREYHRTYYDKNKDNPEFKEKNQANNKRWHKEHPQARSKRYQRLLERQGDPVKLEQYQAKLEQKQQKELARVERPKIERESPKEKVRLSKMSRHEPTVEECERCPHSKRCKGGERCVL